MRRIVFSFFTLILSAALVAAQAGKCTDLENQALELAGKACDGLGRNEICYGYNQVDALDFNHEAVNGFTKTGDIVPIAEISSLSTAPFDPTDESWGIAVLSVQANLPDTLPGQNVSIVLFGDTTMSADEAVNNDSPKLSAQATGNINVRDGAGTNYAVIAGLRANATVTVIGRNQAVDWLLVQLEDGSLGWVSAPLMNVDGDIESVPVRTTASSSPMQAFHISTGIGRTSCEDIPQDGLLIQAPENTVVSFRINGIEVEIGSTALIHANDEQMTVSTFAGEVVVKSEGRSEKITPGLQSSVTSGQAPTKAMPYTGAEVLHAPVDLLPEAVDIPPPAGQEINVTQCYYGSGSVSVNRGRPVILRTGWATKTMDELSGFMDAVTVNLSYDGTIQPLWSQNGPNYDPGRGDYPYFVFWYWVLENPEPGTHQLSVNYDFSHPINIEGQGTVSSYDSLSCQLNVQG